jgi:hypothetical protein
MATQKPKPGAGTPPTTSASSDKPAGKGKKKAGKKKPQS